MTNDHNEFTQRLDDLEVRAAHFEHMADEMSEVLARQSLLIERLGAQIHYLSERMQSLTGRGDPSPQDGSPPPHY
jgi:SlyX protein